MASASAGGPGWAGSGGTGNHGAGWGGSQARGEVPPERPKAAGGPWSSPDESSQGGCAVPLPTGPLPTGPLPTGPLPTGPFPAAPWPPAPFPAPPLPFGGGLVTAQPGGHVPGAWPAGGAAAGGVPVPSWSGRAGRTGAACEPRLRMRAITTHGANLAAATHGQPPWQRPAPRGHDACHRTSCRGPEPTRPWPCRP
jgi:hypothetical protein